MGKSTLDLINDSNIHKPKLLFTCPKCRTVHAIIIQKGNIVEENFSINCSCEGFAISGNLNLEIVNDGG